MADRSRPGDQRAAGHSPGLSWPRESKTTQDSLRGQNLNSLNAPRRTAGLASTCGDPLSGVHRQIQSLLKSCCVLSLRKRGRLGNGARTCPLLVATWTRLSEAQRLQRNPPDGSRVWPSVSGQAIWRAARETQTIYGSPEGTWGAASSEVAAGAHRVTRGQHIGRGPWHLETRPRQCHRSRSVSMPSQQHSQAPGPRDG